MLSCHANFKPKLNQVSTDTGEQYRTTKEDFSRFGKLSSGGRKSPPFYLKLYVRWGLRNSFCHLLFHSTYKGKLN